ncbi:hypothetical protein [Candidatus Nanohalococcus occultus]|uniref:Uncharacterized protein n=1 Tax=Candidatus Nanohalococcus occultus TaxID=2978047 RepID=A0ABY8CE42_9ARCH|nr:hypothetical protein SVXNc_0466 [Candidatus Nanohaloarchaeota archaeon SVXNc]
MTEILKIEAEKQVSQTYGLRYRIATVSSLYFYELIYRFPENSLPHFTATRSTYGKVHESFSGTTRLSPRLTDVLFHAEKTVRNIEHRSEDAETSQTA